MRHKIMIVAGARPNFMKVAPLIRELRRRRWADVCFVHTGQHYDFKMSDIFFKELRLPKPQFHLGVGSGAHGAQTGKIMELFENLLLSEKPALVMVVGDVNSTLACAIAATKLGIRVAHVEAGLRSFDRGMPEEVNRILTDRISDFLFVSEPSGLRHLKNEGIESRKVFYVGNVMIDSLFSCRETIRRSDSVQHLGLRKKGYALVTLHRPSNVDSKKALRESLGILRDAARRVPLVYPVHPRSRACIKKNGLWNDFRGLKNLKMTEPMGYVSFIKLAQEACFILTDSGGVQEEATVLGVPCLTMRDSTERPATINGGSNELVGRDKAKINRRVDRILRGRWKSSRPPKLWDGQTSQRIANIVGKILN